MRRGISAFGLVVAIATLATATAAALPAPHFDRKASEICGQVVKFGRTFDLKSAGKKAPSCGEAQELIARKCRVHLKQEWSCFSFQADDPFIFWFRSRELFRKEHFTRAVFLDRYPCSEATIAPGEFSAFPRGFPSLRQLIADDIVRCDLLAGKTATEVRQLLGRQSEGKLGHYVDYELGLERDSFFQIDSEFLSISYKKNGEVGSVDIFQG